MKDAESQGALDIYVQQGKNITVQSIPSSKRAAVVGFFFLVPCRSAAEILLQHVGERRFYRHDYILDMYGTTFFFIKQFYLYKFIL